MVDVLTTHTSTNTTTTTTTTHSDNNNARVDLSPAGNMTTCRGTSGEVHTTYSSSAAGAAAQAVAVVAGDTVPATMGNSKTAPSATGQPCSGQLSANVNLTGGDLVWSGCSW